MTLTLRIESFSALKEALSVRGQHCFGTVFTNEVGKWAIQFYPHGDRQAKEGSISIFIKNMVLNEGIAAVKIGGNIRILEDKPCLSRSARNASSSSSSSSNGGNRSGRRDADSVSTASSTATTLGTSIGGGETEEEEDVDVNVEEEETEEEEEEEASSVMSGNPDHPSSSRSSSSSINTETTTTTTTLRSSTVVPTTTTSSTSMASASSSSSSSSSSTTTTATTTSYLKITRVFHKSEVYLNPHGTGIASSSSWGFHDFCLTTDLPEHIPLTIEAEIDVKEVVRDNSLTLHVTSLEDLRNRFPRGQSTMGFVHKDGEGATWSICLYPNGDNLSREAQLGVFVKSLALPKGIKAVKIDGNLRLLQGGQMIASRSFPISPPLNPSGVGVGGCSSTWGFHDFVELQEVQDSFIIEADIVVREKVRESSSGSSLDLPEDLNVEQLLRCLEEAHRREVEKAANTSRLLNETQLRRLSLDQLLQLQENITNVLKEKRCQENECSVCQDGIKAIACVPCGHRFCAVCSEKITTCPECRQSIVQKIRLF